VPTLHRAIAFAEMDDVAVRVGGLDLDVPGIDDGASGSARPNSAWASLPRVRMASSRSAALDQPHATPTAAGARRPSAGRSCASFARTA
jgi:hypothetical protein